MTYEAAETSLQSGEPVELYRFIRGAVIIGRFTSGDAPVTVAGETFQPWPGGIRRNNLEISGESGRAGMTLVVAPDFPIAALIRDHPRTGAVGCILLGMHRTDQQQTLRPLFSGRVMSARRDVRSGARVIKVEPLSVSQSRLGVHRVAQPNCNLELYGPLCRLNRDDWEHETTVTAISGRVVTVNSVHADWPYTGGILRRDDEDGVSDYAYIQQAADKVLTLDLLPFGLAVTDTVTIYPGCDWTMATCHNVFGNSANYGGRLNIPPKNPVTDSAFDG